MQDRMHAGLARPTCAVRAKHMCNERYSCMQGGAQEFCTMPSIAEACDNTSLRQPQPMRTRACDNTSRRGEKPRRAGAMKDRSQGQQKRATTGSGCMQSERQPEPGMKGAGNERNQRQRKPATILGRRPGECLKTPAVHRTSPQLQDLATTGSADGLK